MLEQLCVKTGWSAEEHRVHRGLVEQFVPICEGLGKSEHLHGASRSLRVGIGHGLKRNPVRIRGRDLLQDRGMGTTNDARAHEANPNTLHGTARYAKRGWACKRQD